MFQVNYDLQVKIEKVPDRAWSGIDKMVFVMDNFYHNPDEVREYALNSQKYNDKQLLAGTIGRRVWDERINIVRELGYQLGPIFEQLCKHPDWHIKFDQEHHDRKWDHMIFVANVTNNDEIIASGRTTDTACHIDGPYNKWASLVYLNTPEECEGGTDFYSVVPPNDDGTENSPKKEYRCEMVYNRCVLYDANQVHGAVLEPGMFKTCDRMTQVMFM
jgi:hypothetical protein